MLEMSLFGLAIYQNIIKEYQKVFPEKKRDSLKIGR